jgi:hypothetical protein
VPRARGPGRGHCRSCAPFVGTLDRRYDERLAASAREEMTLCLALSRDRGKAQRRAVRRSCERPAALAPPAR